MRPQKRHFRVFFQKAPVLFYIPEIRVKRAGNYHDDPKKVNYFIFLGLIQIGTNSREKGYEVFQEIVKIISVEKLVYL